MHHYPQLDDARHNGRVPAVLDAQQLLSRLHAQILGLVARVLQQEAVLSRVHRLRLLHHAKHCLVHFVRHIRLGQRRHVQLQMGSIINGPTRQTHPSATHRRRLEEQHLRALEHEKARPVALPVQAVAHDALVHPAHVLDAIAHAKVAVVQLHLEPRQAHNVVRDVLEPLAEDGQVLAVDHPTGHAVEAAHLKRLWSQLVRVLGMFLGGKDRDGGVVDSVSLRFEATGPHLQRCSALCRPS